MIADVQRHSTVYPVDHGARVALSDSPEELGPLFAGHKPSIPPIGRRTDEPIDSGETDAASSPSAALRATTPLRTHLRRPVNEGFESRFPLSRQRSGATYKKGPANDRQPLFPFPF